MLERRARSIRKSIPKRSIQSNQNGAGKMSMCSFVGKKEYAHGEPHYSGIQLLALEVLLNEIWGE
jgi:hypothetical protein